MKKINEILIGSNNKGKFKEISDLLPEKIKKISPKQLNISSPEESGKTFIEKEFQRITRCAIRLLFALSPI